MTNTARKGVKKTVRTRATYQRIADRISVRLNSLIDDLIADGFNLEGHAELDFDFTKHKDPIYAGTITRIAFRVIE